MPSLTEIRRQLSQVFATRLDNEYGPLCTDAILKGFLVEKLPVVRVNTLKTSTLTVMSILREQNVRFERVKFLPDSLIIFNKNERFFEDMEIYKNGWIYFQGISSQLPVLFLGLQSGDRVLDMCAAPGSKATQIGIYMKNQGEIVAYEKDQIRCERLKYNLAKQGIEIAKVVLGDSCRLGDEYSGYFDKVLLDAPCSAEGKICISDPRSFKFWSEKNIRENAKLQRRLMRAAFRALKPGGVLVYSTCTLAPEENEMIVLNALLDFKYKLPILYGVRGVLKAMPSNTSEGFFVVKFKKVCQN